MKKRAAALCLILALCLGLAVPALAVPANPFTDVDAGSPYYQEILWAVENGITNGTTESTFSPDAPCTRGQLATFLWRAAGCPEPELTEQSFMDVADPNAYYYKAVQWAGEMHMEYYGEFWPHETCDRLEAAFFLWRAAGSPEMEEPPFTDVYWDVTPDGGQPRYIQAGHATAWATENGIISAASPTTFSPGAPCTRGQIAAFLYRASQI